MSKTKTQPTTAYQGGISLPETENFSVVVNQTQTGTSPVGIQYEYLVPIVELQYIGVKISKESLEKISNILSKEFKKTTITNTKK
jgi:hypothetical protein